MSDIRKWFMKKHDKGGNDKSKPVKSTPEPVKPSLPIAQPDKRVQEGVSGRRKTSKYFPKDKKKLKDEEENEDLPHDVKLSSSRKIRKVDEDDDDNFVMPTPRKRKQDVTPNKKLKGSSGRGISQQGADIDVSDDEDSNDKSTETPYKLAGRGRGGRGSATEAPAAGRGRGGGRGGFMNFGERKDPPHKGEKEVPEGAPDCLAGFTFVISGTLDSLEREEAEDLIKRHGGRVTGSVSKKTNYLLCDEDIGGRKSEKAKELGTAFLTEDGLFDMIHASNQGKASKEVSKAVLDKTAAALPRKSPQKVNAIMSTPVAKGVASGGSTFGSLATKRKNPTSDLDLTWTEKYKPKTPNDIIGNQSLVKQLHDWLVHWNEQFMNTDKKGKGKKQNDAGAKKAVLLYGSPGIGKTTSAKLVSQMLGFQAIEVNASDSRGKADAKIQKGLDGRHANSIKELVSNEALGINMDRSRHPKTVLIMDEVDGMSSGDRGGVADLISSIKMSKIPIICICNDRYSRKLTSLVNYCLLLGFRKPTKQQMAKRFLEIANKEGLQANVIALEELAERVNGDIRMALNQLHYMSLSMSIIQYDDVRQRLLSSAKDVDISPFTAVDKLFAFNGGKLKMDERIDLSMSDPDVVPLIIQENYINYRPNLAGKDDGGMKRMNLIARAAESIGDGDIINVQIRGYQRWQLSLNSSLASSIVPAALLHGQREILEQGERNYNRFGGWLGKNSTTRKNFRLLEDLHVHCLSSRASNSARSALRVDYLTLLLKRLTYPLHVLSKDEAVQSVVEFMDSYAINQEDFDSIVELSKFRGHPNPMDGIQPAVKSALTKAYNQGSKLRVVRSADLITIPGMKKTPKKRIAAILEPTVDEFGNQSDALADSEEDYSDSEDLENAANSAGKLELGFQSLNSKAIQVQLDLKSAGSSNGKKTLAGKGRGGSAAAEKKKGRAASTSTKRKR